MTEANPTQLPINSLQGRKGKSLDMQAIGKEFSLEYLISC